MSDRYLILATRLVSPLAHYLCKKGSSKRVRVYRYSCFLTTLTSVRGTD